MSRGAQVAALATALLNAAIVSLEHLTTKEEWEQMNQPGELNDTVASHAARAALDCVCAAIFSNGLGTCHYVHMTEESDERVMSRSMPQLEGPRAFSCGVKDSIRRAIPFIAEDGRHHALEALVEADAGFARKFGDALSNASDRFESREIVREFFGSPKVEVPAEEVSGE